MSVNHHGCPQLGAWSCEIGAVRALEGSTCHNGLVPAREVTALVGVCEFVVEVLDAFS